MDNRANWVLFLGNYLPGYGINAAARWFTYLCTPVGALSGALSVLLAQAASNHCIVVGPERLEVHLKRNALLIVTCLIPVLLRAQGLLPITNTRANSQASGELTLGERLARVYEKQAGLGSTPELDSISRYISSVGGQVASVLPSRLQYPFVFDPNPDFKSAFALPGGYIIVGGGLLAIAQTEDELANVLAHEIEHVELGQVSRRVSELGKQKGIKNLELSEFLPGFTKEEELACDLHGQQLAAQAGYSPAGMLTLLCLRHSRPCAKGNQKRHPRNIRP
jgi:predicted Zn-dependent protease